MFLSSELKTITYKKEQVTFRYWFYEDSSNGHQYTTTELDKTNLSNLNSNYKNLTINN